MFGEYIVQIVERPGTYNNRVYLYKHNRGYGTEYITHNAEYVTIKEGEMMKEDDVYFAEMSPDQLQAFAEALANKGIKTTKDSVAIGKLQATERHLEDMRLIALHKFNSVENRN